jgi:DNA-directed RNA polymerase subunit RPC12/RpoP
MSYMFGNSKFKRKICNWDVSNVVNMRGMFLNLTECYTHRWDISSLVYGKEEIIKLGAKIPEIKKMVQLIEEGYEECPVTREVIEGDYFKCSTCKHCFDMEVEKWIDENKQCPYCRSKWGKKIMYSQS